MESVIDSAISSWNRLLADDPIAKDPDAVAYELEKAGLIEGGNTRCNVLRPRFVTASRYHDERELTRNVVKIHEKMLAGIESGQVPDRNLGGLKDWIRQVRSLDPRPESRKAAWLRLDASLARTQLHAIELNGDTPGGEGHNDSAIALFKALPATERFIRQFDGQFLPLLPRFESQILTRAGEVANVEKPSIAWACWDDKRNRETIVEGMTSYLVARGCPVVFGDPEEFEVSEKETRLKGQRIHVILRACLTPEILERRDQAQALVQAAQSNHTVVLNPLGTEPLGHKVLFAAISDPELNAILSPAERRIITRHIPWTRLLVEQRTTSPKGTEIDLLPWVLDHQSQLVLKPMHGHAGEGVLLGWHTDQKHWETAVHQQLGESIVQMRVHLHSERYPVIDQNLAEEIFYEDTDPFLFDGETVGTLTRLSTSEITNVSTGGGVTATMVLSNT
ncbi:MAG: hypothetical protein AAGD22_06945 [Verrucomicrobiota bacterium]